MIARRLLLVPLAAAVLAGCLPDDKDINDSKPKVGDAGLELRATSYTRAFFWEAQPQQPESPYYTKLARADRLAAETNVTLQLPVFFRQYLGERWQEVEGLDSSRVRFSSFCASQGWASLDASVTEQPSNFQLRYTPSSKCSNDVITASYNDKSISHYTLERIRSSSGDQSAGIRLDLINLPKNALDQWPVHSQGFFRASLPSMPTNGETVLFRFGSDCSLQETAELTATELESFSGHVEVGYRPSYNCTRDTLVVRAEVEGEQVASKSLNITTTTAEAYSLSFDGFTPAVAEGHVARLRRKDINTNGLLVENRTLTFTLRDVSGSPVGAGHSVSFELQAGVNLNALAVAARPKLSHESSITDVQGQVRVSLEGGADALPFNVKASLLDEQGNELDPEVFALSPSIFVTSGLASLARFNLFKSHFEEDSVPYSSREYDFRALIGDEHGHPLPDGTPVSFVDKSSGVGSIIEPGCLLGESGPGQCRVNWYGDTSNFPIRVEATTSGTGGPVTRSSTWNPAND